MTQITEPYLQIYRGILPPLFGQLDFTPLFGFLILQVRTATTTAAAAAAAAAAVQLGFPLSQQQWRCCRGCWLSTFVQVGEMLLRG
jgi:hypothetical protein